MGIKDTIKLFLPKYQKLILEYRTELKPRYEGKPHPLLYDMISQSHNAYRPLIDSILRQKGVFHNIRSVENENDPDVPAWNNGYLPGLDIVTLYTMIGEFKPERYIEIGSGNSTKVARKSVKENNLSTKIISIDPYPRANIDHLADQVIRKPLETIEDLRFITGDLKENDILFIDNSHRCLPNSDVTVCFLDLLPYLKPGVIVHIHDIYLPYDYPREMCRRFYSEQYVLAACLLTDKDRFELLFPAFYVSQDAALSGLLAPLWDSPNTADVERHGGSFWFKMA